MDFTHPVATTQISSGYGLRKDPFTGKTSFHKGLDYKVAKGTLVYPSLPAKVLLIDSDTSYGNRIILDHGNDIQTLYAHLDNFLVGKGDQVTQDTPIAYSGNSGRSTAPHLHFEIFINKKTVDPSTLLKLPPQTKKQNSFIPFIILGGILFLIYKK